MDWFWIFFLVLLLFGGSGAAFVKSILESRQNHRLEMKKQERAIAEAKAKAAEATIRQQALDLRSAELEIERFDRRMGTTGLPAIPQLTSGVEPNLLRDIAAAEAADEQREKLPRKGDTTKE
jgi:hypothetical protein